MTFAGEQLQSAEQMAAALIIQLGQDAEELRAFIADLTAKNLNTALNYPIPGFVAQAGAQSY
ncbi:hypothetical protein TREAZ_0655 [Leadbettera azotonutricia ZAS-9]|uniref:Uncharacterized protein n=1 Tax=Leadbettera azotonutricia (strain ATCC BAA-888 / DSM 13862 / ZAS-9) TaxID=545695 RepID=F5YAX4_LEAAZ|nr:hypothetical protein TREAZ_0655 [Leadbettera azotonutricia ZAS-9]